MREARLRHPDPRSERAEDARASHIHDGADLPGPRPGAGSARGYAIACSGKLPSFIDAGDTVHDPNHRRVSGTRFETLPSKWLTSDVVAYSFSSVQRSGCWLRRANSVTWVTFVSATS